MLGRFGASNDPETGKEVLVWMVERGSKDQERHGRCSPAIIQPKNIRNGNRKKKKCRTSYNNKLLDLVLVQMHQTLSLLMKQALSSLHLPNKEASASASKRCHILLSSHQQTSAQFPTGSLILFSLHRVIHLAAAYMKTPQNTKTGRF